MNRPSLPLPTVAAAGLAAALFAITLVAQAPEPQQQPPAGAAPQGQAGPPVNEHWERAPRVWPKPTNLQVLPKTLTGNQVREIMEKWQGDLGVHCNTCHAEDPKNLGPNGRPRLNFADDSKAEKRTARLMFTMTEKINGDYLSMVGMDQGEGEGEGHVDRKVTCGTCHRGHQKPEAFIPPPEHEGPRGPQGPPVAQPQGPR